MTHTPYELHDLLDKIFDSDEDAQTWLDSEIPALGDRKPNDLIAAGEEERVVTVLAAIWTGAYL